MRTLKTIRSIRKAVGEARRRDDRVGFVPTMGALHDGHLALIRRCRKENDLVVVSIFVNPSQFASGEDLKDYPRPRARDLRLARLNGADIIFYPAVKDIYPRPFLTHVEVEKLGEILCGRSRPEHFRGVATVVTKLLNIVSPDTLYLGQKDAQQSVLIKQLVKDLNIPVTVRVVATVREKDGLAMSSRNQYLTPAQRREAAALYASLRKARRMIKHGERDVRKILNAVTQHIHAHSTGKIDYIACLNADDLSTVKKLRRGSFLLSLAVKIGRARLIDNLLVQIK